MTERQVKNGLKKWHRWLGLGAAVFLLVTALTGFLLEHPGWLGDGPTVPTALAADPERPGRYLRGGRWGLEESLDAGSTWRELPMLIAPENVRRIHFCPAEPGRVFALGPRTLVTSADGGRVWEEVRVPADPATGLVDLTTGPAGEWLVLTGAGLYVSSDGGRTWAGDPAGHPEGRDWRGFVHDVHTGQVFGAPGRRVAEATALAVVFLTVSGLFIVFRRGRRRQR